MNVRVVRLALEAAVRIAGTARVSCDGAVFRDDYAACTNRAVQRRGQWHLCASHARKDELEIVVDNEPML